jgi:AraC-like DNA-binding protein
MGGFFGVASNKDCVFDLFFGTDYHSHLGTKRGGMALYNPENGFQRAIHNIENSPFRTKFERDVEEMSGNLGIGCISDTEPQPLIVRSHLGNFANIVFIHDPNNCEWSRLRGLSFSHSMSKQNHQVKILSLGDFERALPSMTTPIAVFAAFDLLATNVIKSCRKANLSIPEDVVVLGVDNDSSLCENTYPSLSSIRLDHEKLGFCAAKTLDALMTGKGVQKNIELPPLDVIVRNSTAYISSSRLLVERAMRIIKDHENRRINVTDIARQLGVSTSLLKLRFQQIHKCSLRDILISTRLNKVTELLKTSDYQIGGIAKMCGFSSAVVLNHLFKKKFGMSPSIWRSINK